VTTPSSLSQTPPTFFQHIRKRESLLGFLAGIAVTAGISAVGGMTGMDAWHHGDGAYAKLTPAEQAAHVQKMLQHFYIEVDATDEQKQKLEPIVKQAIAELMPLHSQFHAAHEQVVNLLTQDTIDRAALETLRASHIQLADQSSERITQALADVGDALTPVQRRKLVEAFAHQAGVQH
jgi:Spy/CpxP family protein refolding chaperone